MKRLFTSVLWATGLLLVVFACKDDDEPVVANRIIGQWQGDRAEAKVTYSVVTLHERVEEAFDALLEFREDGTVSVTRGTTTTDGTYDLNGNTLTTNVDFQYEGVDIQSMTFTVGELTETRLVLDLDQDQEVDVPDFGMVKTTIKGKFEFDRL